MKSLNKSLLLVALTTSLFAVSAASAAASTIYYELREDHCSLPDGCGGDGHLFGAVKLEDAAGGDGVILSVILADGSKFVETGFPNGELTSASIAFNLIGNPALTSIPSQLELLSGSAGKLKFKELGQFEYALDCLICGDGGGEGDFGPLSVKLIGDGLDVSDFAELSSNRKAYFAVNRFSGITGQSGVGSTGAVTENPLTTVPDGGPTMALLGSAILGLGLLHRKLGQG